MKEKTKKATFNLHTSVLEALNDAMAQGIAPSKNTLVEQALIKELNELKRQARKVRWQAAAKDPLFLGDIEQAETDFEGADNESAGSIG
jgi:hypothetical protein